MGINKRAKKYIRKILEYYETVNLKMELNFESAADDLFIFSIDFVPGTTERKIRQYLPDVRQTLKFQHLQLHREGMELFFVASEHNAFDNRLLGILTSPSYPQFIKDMEIPYPIGFDSMRRPIVVDVIPHLNWLLGGAGFSGKTTSIQSMVVSILWSCSPERVNLIIIDEPANLIDFDNIPHLSCPIIHSIDARYNAIMELKKEMKRRLKMRDENPKAFILQPFIVCFIDECVSFIAGAGDNKKVLADSISLLLRMCRHAKIYLVLSTQNPSLDEMKCDLSPVTSRIAFTVGKPTNSVTILGEGGAETLSGKGEMYFKSQRHSGLMYIKGSYITSEEISKVCDYIRGKYEETAWDVSRKFTIDTETLQSDEADMGEFESTTITQDIDDKTLAKVIMWTLERKTVSGNAIDGAFKNIGARKANRFVEKLCKLEIAGEANVKMPRSVLPSCIESLSEGVVSLLNRHGYNADDIITAFSKRKP